MNRWIPYSPQQRFWQHPDIYATVAQANYHATRAQLPQLCPLQCITEQEEPLETDEDVEMDEDMETGEGGVTVDGQAMDEEERDTTVEVGETVERTPLCESLPVSSPNEHISISTSSDATGPNAPTIGHHLEPQQPADSFSDPLLQNMARLDIRSGDAPSPSTH